MKHEAIIYGNAPSKANQYKIITLGGHGSLAKTKALKEYEEKFYLQCSYRNKNIQGFLKFMSFFIFIAINQIWIIL